MSLCHCREDTKCTEISPLWQRGRHYPMQTQVTGCPRKEYAEGQTEKRVRCHSQKQQKHPWAGTSLKLRISLAERNGNWSNTTMWTQTSTVSSMPRALPEMAAMELPCQNSILDFTVNMCRVSLGVSVFRLWLISYSLIGFNKHILIEASELNQNKERNIQYNAGDENKLVNLKKIVTKTTLSFVLTHLVSPPPRQKKPLKNIHLHSQKLLMLFVIFSPDLNVQHILPVREVVKIKLFPPLRICTLTQCLENMQL